MATLLQIPTNSNGNPSFSETISIDGVYYKLNFKWNTRDTCWLLDFLDINDNPIMLGIKLTVEYELITLHALPVMPLGSLFLLDLSATYEPCGFEDLGGRCKLYYLSPN
jgi:hypothetical protein